MDDFAPLLAAIRDLHRRPEGFLPLHAPVFAGNERAYVLDTIETTVVSSIGGYVDRFEDMLRDLTGAAAAVAAVNGTAALHMALMLAGVRPGDLVLTQGVSFVASANAVVYCGAEPVFLDVDADTLGLSPEALRRFLDAACERASGGCRHRDTGRRVAACLPVHTFGHPCRIEEITEVCAAWNLPVVEDAAEALGSRVRGRHGGTFGRLGTLSFNGNKICTCGGGGAILTDDPELGRRAKHLTTTARLPHPRLFAHDELGWNYRLPNLNAALGCAQLERLDAFLADKRALAAAYARFLAGMPWTFVPEPAGATANYWLCAVLMRDEEERDAFLEASNRQGIMTRPLWRLLWRLPMYERCLRDAQQVAQDIERRLVNLPSGMRREAVC